jgi:excisionase family DNA binding protein
MKNQPISGNSATSPATPSGARADDFLTSKELATVLKISIRTVQRWEHEGMPTHRRHRTARFPLSQIREWMKATNRGR